MANSVGQDSAFWISFILVVSIFSFFFSVLTLSYLKFIRNHRKASSYSFINLLCINIIQSTVTLPCFAMKNTSVHGRQRQYFRDIYLFTYLLLSHASTYSLLLMSLDRVVSLLKPLLYRKLMSKTNTMRILLLIWLLLITVDFLPFVRSLSDADADADHSYNPTSQWTITVVLCMNVVPMLVLIFCWVYIVRVAMHHYKKLYAATKSPATATATVTTGKNNKHYLKRMKATRITMMLLSMYILCFGPSSLYHMLEHSCPVECFPPNFFRSADDKKITFYLKMLNFLFMLAPPLIFCGNKNFLNYLKAKVLHMKSHEDIKMSVITYSNQ